MKTKGFSYMEEETNTEVKTDRSYISQTSGLQGKDYIGYALGDFAGCLCFSTVSTVLQKYYTDILGLTPLFIMIMFIVARVWDAINDPIMGRIVDLRKPGKDGRYRPWMKWVAIPLALSTILMFLPWPGLAEAMTPVGVMAYATITYIAFGMLYTVHQIPYGSLASVVTTDSKERNKLSVFRSVGSALGSMPILILTMFYSKNKMDANGNEIIGENGKTLTQVQYLPIIIGVSVMAIVAAVLLFVAYKNNKERVVAQPKPKVKGETWHIAKTLLKSRNFVGVCLVGLLLLAGQMFTQSFYTYLFNDLFSANWMNLASQACTYAPMVILMFFAGKLVRKFGKKEICAVGGLLAAVPNFILIFLKSAVVAHPIIFLPFCLISGFGISIIGLEMWALATDAIDDVEVKTGLRNDGSSYSTFMFFRKMGQVVAAVAVNAALIAMNYKSGAGEVQTMDTLNKMYYMATAIPAGLFLMLALVLFFLYGLSKKKTDELQIEKEALLKKQVESNEIKIGE